MRPFSTTAAFAGATILALAQPVLAAGNNDAPPPGAILDLGGLETAQPAQTVDHGTATSESVNFVANLTDTDITIAIREDPAFISLYDVALVDITTSSGNVLLNGDFTGGIHTSNGYASAPADWNYDNQYGATFPGIVSTVGAACGGAPVGATNCWYDGAVQAYDAIDQIVGTNPGDTYQLSFLYSDNGPLGTFSDLSTNGDTTDIQGNGIDILAYAEATTPPPCPVGTVCGVPEPASVASLTTGLIGLIGLRWRRRRAG